MHGLSHIRRSPRWMGFLERRTWERMKLQMCFFPKHFAFLVGVLHAFKSVSELTGIRFFSCLQKTDGFLDLRIC